MPVSQPLPDGPFVTGQGTPAQDTADIVAFLLQKGNATDTEILAAAASESINSTELEAALTLEREQQSQVYAASADIRDIVKVTQAQYDALVTKVTTTLYVIVG